MRPIRFLAMSSRLVSLGALLALLVSGCSGPETAAPPAMAGSRIAIATQPQLASSSERVSVGGFGAVNDYDPFAAPKVVATVTVPYAYDVAFGGDGNAYVSSESDNAVHVYTPRGTFARAISVPSPRGIGFDPQGNLYVADATSIAVYPPNADKPARRITGVIDPQIALD